MALQSFAAAARRLAISPTDLRQLVVLVALLVGAGSVWLFIEIADEVIEGETRAFDRTLMLALRSPSDTDEPLGPVWLEEVARDVTALGGVSVLIGLTLAVAGFLVLRRKYRATLLMLLGVGGGWVLSLALKVGFDRPRPDLVPHASHVYTASFPSGHSMMAAVTYLTLAAMVARVQPGAALKIYVLFLAVVAMVSVGVSRVYLGVHWPTDVIGGWAAGAAWAIAWWFAARWLQRRGRIETDTAAGDNALP